MALIKAETSLSCFNLVSFFVEAVKASVARSLYSAMLDLGLIGLITSSKLGSFLIIFMRFTKVLRFNMESKIKGIS